MYGQKGQCTEAQRKQACFALKSRISLALALLSVFYPGALERRASSGRSSVLCAGSQKTSNECRALANLKANLIDLYKLLDTLDYNFNRLFLGPYTI